MKQSVTIIALTILTSVACKKSTPETSISSKLIVGKWFNNKHHFTISTLQGVQKKDTTLYWQAVELTGYVYIFNADGTAYITHPKNIKVGNKYQLVIDTNSWLNYRVSGNTLYTSQQGETDEFPRTIVTLNSTTLRLDGESMEYPSTGDGVDMNMEYNFTYQSYFTKQ